MLRQSEPVYKITAYMTPSQWNRMSEWSATHYKGSEHEQSPWLYMIHETNKSMECAQLKNDMSKQTPDKCIYTSDSSI